MYGKHVHPLGVGPRNVLLGVPSERIPRTVLHPAVVDAHLRSANL